MNSCIDIAVRRIGDILSASSKRQGEGMSLRTERKGEMMSYQIERMSEMAFPVVERIGEAMSFRCGLVCTVGAAAYLNVEPETLWLIPDNNFSTEVVVYANVRWRIE